MLITGRIATLAGERGFGWVEAVGIRDGRIAFAGSEVALETRADPFTERIALEPDEVAIPGLTDAHLHLAGAADATRQVDLSGAATLAEGLARIGAAHVRRWRSGCLARGARLGRGPLGPLAHRRRSRGGGAGPPRRVVGARSPRPARRADAALTTAGLDRGTARPQRRPHPARRARRARGRAARGGHPARHAPRPTDHGRGSRGPDRGRLTRAPGARRRRRPRPGAALAGPGAGLVVPRLRTPVRARAAAGARAGLAPRRRARHGARGRAAQRRDPRREPRRPCPDRLAEVLRGRVARIADGGAAGRHRAGAGPAARARAPAWRVDHRARRSCASASSGRRPAASRPRSTASATRPCGLPSTRSSRRPRRCRSCPRSSTSSCWTRPMSGASPPRGSWRASSRRISGATPSRPDGCGATGPSGAATPGHRSRPPAPSSRSGRTRRSSRSIRGPGSRSLSVARIPAGLPGHGRSPPDEALSLERALRAACVGPAQSANERDRGRLTVGQRADIVVIPAASLDEPVEPGGALATTRPTMVLVDGRVAFEA